MFRAGLPIRPVDHDFHAAADGQLGGIMKVYREWRISGDTEWLRALWPKVKASLDYCIDDLGSRRTRAGRGAASQHLRHRVLGPDGMCTSFYLGALCRRRVLMGEALGDDVAALSRAARRRARAAPRQELFNGEYFIQKIEWKSLRAENPLDAKSMVGEYSPEARRAAEEGRAQVPVRQRAASPTACSVRGWRWSAASGRCSIAAKVASHLAAVHNYNLKRDLSTTPTRSGRRYACGEEGGLLLCTWPKGGELSLPFVYSNEVWTGIEYQVASHLMLMGRVEEGLDIVRACRGPLRRTRPQPLQRIRVRPLVRARDVVLRAAPGAERRALRRRGQSAVPRAAHQRRLPRLPFDRHRLRHRRHAQRQTLYRGEKRKN